MTGKLFRNVVLWLLLAILAACAGAPTIQQTAVQASPPARDVIAEVRAAASEGNDGIEVIPLSDPVIEDLRDAAIRHEGRRAFDRAEAALERALALVPNDPELIQWRAELALAQGRYDDAVRLANASWETGPRLGALCRRNWAAIRIARELSGFPDAGNAAATQMARCTVEPPVRM